MAREKYNPATTGEKITLPGVSVPEAMTVGETVQRQSERAGTDLLGDNRAGEALNDLTGGTTGVSTEALNTGELALGELMEGDVAGLLRANTVGATDATLAVGDTAVAVPASLEKLLTGGDRIQKTYNSTKNVVKKITGGSFWCTEIFNQGLVTKKQYNILNIFMKSVMDEYGAFFNWYIDNGERILEEANNKGFNWSIGKDLLFTKLIKAYRNGDKDACVKLYGKFTEIICEIIGEKPPVELYQSTKETSLPVMNKVNKFYGRV